eukprot:755798-Hanusia_phi.AAC.3
MLQGLPCFWIYVDVVSVFHAVHPNTIQKRHMRQTGSSQSKHTLDDNVSQQRQNDSNPRIRHPFRLKQAAEEFCNGQCSWQVTFSMIAW